MATEYGTTIVIKDRNGEEATINQFFHGEELEFLASTAGGSFRWYKTLNGAKKFLASFGYTEITVRFFKLA